MGAKKAVIIGAGIGGLAAAALLSHAGIEVTVCEAQATPGGKLRQVAVGNAKIDAGPTVFTMRSVFEDIFTRAGARLDEHIQLKKLDIIARHAWEDGARLDLFSDPARNEDAMGVFGGLEAARGYAAFSNRSRQIFETLDAPFMQSPQPGLLGLAKNTGFSRAGALMKLSPFATLWDELGRYFSHPKLRQLFARYSTYCGSSPFTAPATLMLIAHAEQMGVWQVKGGMIQLANALAALAQSNGTKFLYNVKIAEITAQNGRVTGVQTSTGERIAADAVIANADLAALNAGLFGAAAQAAVAGSMKGAQPSLSAVTWVMTGRSEGFALHNQSEGFALHHHNVFFSNDYPREFVALARGKLPEDPTVYICAANRSQFFCLINAPAFQEEQQCLSNMLAKLTRCGLKLTPEAISRTGPPEFATLFPGSGGALYGRALEGWRDSFARPGAGTKLPGLYLAGGSVHPGPGLPMAALSGKLAALRLLADLTSASRSAKVAMPGGMSMPSALTGRMP